MYTKFVSLIISAMIVTAFTASGTWASEKAASQTAAVGKTAPTIQAKTIEGKEFSLKDLRGKVVLVDFWGTWCPPCRDELPHLKETYEKFNKKGFEIVSMALRDTPDTVKEFTKEHEMEWIHIIDDGFKFAETYQVRAVPTPFLLDHTGKIVLRGTEDMFDKDLRGEQLMKDVEKYVKLIPDNKEKSAE